ncbi:hypothetical protein NLX83_20730 [Allokutzneria sp. A3M-2-11 16]|uniref:hypothetical protein n=1 Tax=Allokutzneria sp. A3M-2-11 16 TaxID=2962043 RepID=UPI0020B9008C|nr:hypothetical protein [Allokutzneria sp. A3M-2-11 16]MCP3801692.1 hypothetical protein [Allokutzneria sp. A3M-2-11 16]
MVGDRHFSGSDNYAGMSLEQLRDLLGSVPDSAAAHLARDFQERGKVAVQLADRMNKLADRLAGRWQAPSVDKAKKAGDGLRGYGDTQQQAAQQISAMLEPAATKANSVSETVKTLTVSGREFPKNTAGLGPQSLALINADHARYEQQKEAKRREAIELGAQLDKQAAAMDSGTPPFPTIPANFFDPGGEPPPRPPRDPIGGGGGAGGGWSGVQGGPDPSPDPAPVPQPTPAPHPNRRGDSELAGSDNIDTKRPLPPPNTGSDGDSRSGGSGGIGAGGAALGGMAFGAGPSGYDSPRSTPSPGTGRPGTSSPAPPGAGAPHANTAAPRGAGGGFLQPALGGTGQRAEDEEHQRKYPITDDLVGELPLVAPPVIGEYSDDER